MAALFDQKQVVDLFKGKIIMTKNEKIKHLKANIEAIDDLGCTPLILAAKKDHLESFKVRSFS